MGQISVKNLTVKYSDDFSAIRNIDFCIENNSLTALCGLSGSGKTTVALALCGLADYSGKILFDGKIPESVVGGRRGVGYIPQSFNLLGVSVDKTLSYAYRIRKIETEEYSLRRKNVIDICGIQNLIDRKISSLSTEEKSLVAIARLFMRDNLLYIIDCDVYDYAEKIIELKNFFNATVLYLSSRNDRLTEKADKKYLLRDGILQDEQCLFACKFYDELLNVCELSVRLGVATSAFFNGKIDLPDGKYYLAVKSEDIEEGDGAEVLSYVVQAENLSAMRVKGISYYIYSDKKVAWIGCKKATVFDLNGNYIESFFNS